MTPDTLRELLAEHGHGEHADVAVTLFQPSFKIVGTRLASAPYLGDPGGVGDDPDPIARMDAALAELPAGASRFGGVPDLPPGVAWPERAGLPMEFVAQIDLSTVPADSLGRLPAEGSLLFFWNSQWDTYDYDDDYETCAVLFHAGPASELVRTMPPQTEFESQFQSEPQVGPRLHGLASVVLEPSATLPPGCSPYLPDEFASFWGDFFAEHHQVLAGADQWADNRLLGHLGGDDYVGAHINGTDDQLLLQVDSDACADFEWGDCHRLYFMMSKAELAARDFSKVRIYMELG